MASNARPENRARRLMGKARRVIIKAEAARHPGRENKPRFEPHAESRLGVKVRVELGGAPELITSHR